MSGFKVKIDKGIVQVVSEDDVPETDIIDLLEFDEAQMEDLYLNHAATQCRWEQVAINLKNEYDRFSDNFEKKWWAHNKRFAKLVLIGYGEKKPTVDAIKDTALLVYSQDTSEHEREKYFDLAYKNGMTEKDLEGGGKEQFKNEMFKYLLTEPAWYFETVLETSKLMEKHFLTVQNIAKRLDSRSYHMKELKDLLMAKRSNIGPMTEKETNRTKELQHIMTEAHQGGQR